MKNLPPEYPYLGVEVSDLKLSTTAIIGRDLEPQKLITTKRNLE